MTPADAPQPMKTSQPQPNPGRTEPSGAGVVTLLVLLLLVGGVDGRSAQAFQRAATGLVREEVAAAVAPRVTARRHRQPDTIPTGSLRDTRGGERPARSVADATLPAPRAPDRGRTA